MSAAAPLRLAYLRHPWPYPSAACLLAGIARVNVLKRRDMAAMWLSGRASVQLAKQLDGLRNWIDDETVASTLRLSRAEVVLAFDSTRWWPAALRTFAIPFADPLRFCPSCLRTGYHCHLFQLPWWARCPLHDTAILDQCPSCAGRLGGLRLGAEPCRAFHCSRCEWDAVDTGELIMASRRGFRDRLHQVVATHAYWASAVSEAFVVAPTLVSPYCEVGAPTVMKWIRAAGVPCPRELRRFLVEATFGPAGPHIRRSIPKEDLQPFAQLSARIAESMDRGTESHVNSGDPCTFPAAEPSAGKVLCRVERALQRAAGADFQWGGQMYEFKRRQRLSERALAASNIGRFHDAIGIRERGIRLRSREISLTRSNASTILERRGYPTIDTASFRLLSHVREALVSMETQQAPSVVTGVFDWWYVHLMALALVEGSIAATHSVAWAPPNGPMRLPGWPPIDLERHPPGQSWVLAATYRDCGLVAYLEPVRLARLARPDVMRVRELRQIQKAAILTFQIEPMLHTH